MKFNWFKVIESARVDMRKPDSDIYLYTCEKLGLTPTETVFLGIYLFIIILIN